MALKRQAATELRLARRYLMVALLSVPLLAALAGFGMQQSNLPHWPEAPSEPLLRGRILAADGTILAEGGVSRRRYPQSQLAAHLIGFSGAVQPDGRYGLEGLEYTMEHQLGSGQDVRITIDPTLQAAAEARLAESVETSGSENGAVVMLEVGSGRVLAAASYPSYDPNRQGRYPRSSIQNRAFLQQYEPGSVMKPFVVAALLESGRLTPDERIPAEPCRRVGDKTFCDVARHEPELPVADVLAFSSNTAMTHLTERFSAEEPHAWLDHYGVGRPVGMPSAFTRSGLLNAWRNWVPQDQASITIGQSMSVTPLQLAAAYSIFAHDGVLISPYLVEGEQVPAPRRVLSSEVARTVRGMLQHTVESSGLRRSKIPGVSVAGKTGTADIFDAVTGTYPDDWYSLTFAGMFPAEAPRVVMVVTVQKPSEETSSTYVAAPLFRAIGSEVVAHWGAAGSAAQLAQQGAP